VQSDDSWKSMKFSAENGVVENVVRIAIHFDTFSPQEVSVKSLTVRLCVPESMFLQFITTLASTS